MRKVLICHLICLGNETAPIRLYESWHVPLLRSQQNPPEKSDSTGNTQPTPAPRWWAACRDVKSRPGTDRPHPHCPWWDAHHHRPPAPLSACVRHHPHLHLSCEPSSHPIQQRGEECWRSSTCARCDDDDSASETRRMASYV